MSAAAQVHPSTKEIIMTVLHALWLPILLSSVFVFVASSIIHMALPWHRSDHSKMPEEDKVREALRPLAIPAGDYMVPLASNMQEMRTPEFKEKMNKGPVIVLTVLPNGPFQMGRSLSLWFAYLVVVSFFTAYITCHALPIKAAYMPVFRIAGTASFLGYSAALWQMSIWYRRSWLTTLKMTIDGLVFAGLTAGTFGWLWPR